MRKASFLFKILSITALGLILISCAGRPPAIQIPSQAPPPPVIQKPAKVVLVLGSGGARGYAHLGVLQALAAAGIPIDGIVCASAGCVMGALYADNQNPKKTYDIMMRAGYWDFADVSNFPSLKGVVKGYHLEKFLLKHMRARNFGQLRVPLFVATTDLKTGKAYLIRSGPIAPAVLASSALPGLVQPIRLYGRILVDGGVASPVPTRFARLLKPEVVIAVNIAEELKKEVPHSAFAIYSRAYSIMWQRQTESSLHDANIVIRPRVGQVGTFDLSNRYKLYLAGLKAGNKLVPKIKKLLKNKGIPLKTP